MPRVTHRVGALLLPLVLLTVAACSAGPSDRPAVAYRGAEQQVPAEPPAPKPVPTPPLGPAADNALSWRDCTERTSDELAAPVPPELTFSCSRLLTSLSPPNPSDGGTARISLLSVGTGSVPLVVVDGLRGETGTTLAARWALSLPPEVLNTFKIIGMDRRGLGGSEPVECVPPADRAAIVGFDPRADRREQIDRLLNSVRSASQECLLELSGRAQAYDTWRTASDLEELRIELGVPKLHAIGRGGGSRVLTTYSERYPDSVGRMVLDGAPDPSLDALRRTRQRAENAESTFDAFAAACAENAPCPLGPDPRGAFDELVERSRGASLPGPGSPVTAGEIVRATLHGLADPSEWPRLVRALDKALHGDGSGIAEMIASRVSGGTHDPARLDPRMITRCNDTSLRLPPQRSTEIAAAWNERYPLIGGALAQQLIRCSLWPLPRKPVSAPRNPGLPPMPVIATAHDPFTPAQGTRKMASRLAAGVTITWQGSGHGAIGRSQCVTGNVSRFLVHGAVPTADTVCPA